MSATISQMRGVESQVVGSIIAQSRALRRGADRSALVTGIVVLSTLVLLLILTAIIASSMVRPLRRLRAGALDVAGVRLPEKVRQLSETGGGGETFDVEPIDVTSTDEVGEVARAFDQVHREALRLAANEAMLRSNVNAMFVSLSRRSRSLVERQIKLIDELEQGEQDAERLSNLFRLDHLATRMRRNSDNLLVLAGHDTVRRWGNPVTLVDVLRAAVSEIEQYKRVTLNIQPGNSVAGNAVNDVVHLLAELLENAASYSPGDTPVKVAGHPLTSGGVLLDITDHGVGMGAEEMANANWRLENPPVGGCRGLPPDGPFRGGPAGRTTCYPGPAAPAGAWWSDSAHLAPRHPDLAGDHGTDHVAEARWQAGTRATCRRGRAGAIPSRRHQRTGPALE